MNALMENWFGCHLWPLVLKETREILRNKHVLFLLLIPPVVQLLIIGAALDPQVRNLSLGIVDSANTHESRDLVYALGESGVFPNSKKVKDSETLSHDLERSQLDVGVVIPQDFSRKIDLGQSAEVQVLIDGSDAYSAGIANGYLERIINAYKPSTAILQRRTVPIKPEIEIMYNPGLLSSWFFVPGVLGATLTLTATLVASAAVLRERESGTMEQLLMTPAESWEIVLAKLIPLVVFLVGDVYLAVFSTSLVFGLPFRGSMLLFSIASLLYVFIGIGIGMLLGTICTRQRQAQLTSFFINIPLILLSGTVVPFDTMPPFLQAIALFDPLRYYATVARSVILKGVGWDVLWPNLLILMFCAALVLTASIWRFRRQMA